MPKKILLALVMALCCTSMAWANCGKCGDKHEGSCDEHPSDMTAEQHEMAAHEVAMHDMEAVGMADMGDHDAFKEGRLVSINDCRVLDPRCCPGDCYKLMDEFHNDCEPKEEELERCDCCPEKCEKCEQKPCTCEDEDDDDEVDEDCNCHCYMPYQPLGPRQPLVTVHLWDPLYESNLEPLVEEEYVEEVITVPGRGS
jgi:hypothetical protein